MKKIFIIVPILLALGFSIFIGIFYYKHLRGVGPAISDPPYPITGVIDIPADNPLKLPPGFDIEVFAENLSGARVIAFDRYGNIWVSRPKEGKISVVVVRDGKAEKTIDVLSQLTNPHGLLFDYMSPDTLYIAEETKISLVSISYIEGSTEPASIPSENIVKLVDLTVESAPHSSRTLAYTPDGQILVSIGSSCNVCYEESSIRATIQKLENKDGVWELTPYAAGLRNSVFMATNPVDGKIWATEMGRDLLGDHIPPDELNIIEEGKNYGWPICYGNRIHDVNFDSKTYVMDPCATTAASTYDLPAHVAPLGLAFIPEESFWPEEYWLDLLVAYHGSWNRSVPTGYSIVRIMLDAKGGIVGEELFIDGWLTAHNKAVGRPVDLKFMNGSLFVSDDHAGVIYRVFSTTDTPSPVEPLVDVDFGSLAEPYRYDFSQPSIIFTGKARGTMFFEASFPVVVTDNSGVVVGRGIAEAGADWMTTEYVPFSVTVSQVTMPTTSTGIISFIKDNPSGLPEHEYAYSVPVIFE